MWYLDLCLYSACLVRKNLPHKSQLWPCDGKWMDSRWFLTADLSWQCLPHSRHKYPVPDFSMKLSMFASQSDTSIPRKKVPIIPYYWDIKLYLWYLDLWVYNACLVFINLPQRSQLWPCDGKWIDSRWFLAADFPWNCLPHSLHV